MSKGAIFIDTGARFAIADRNDQFHKKATEAILYFSGNNTALFTSNLVIHETVMLLSRKISKKVAIAFLEKVNLDDRITILQSNNSVEQQAYELFRAYKDQDFSITDCVSFIVMKSNGIKRAFTFDKHFSTMKLIKEP